MPEIVQFTLAAAGSLMVGAEDPAGEILPLRLMVPEKLLMGVKNIERLAQVLVLKRN